MIEIRNNPDSKNERKKHLLYIDGDLMENAFPYITRDGYCQITSRDKETSHRIAAHTINEFPQPVGEIFLHDYPDNIEHLDSRYGTTITNHVEVDLKAKSTVITGTYRINLAIGMSALPKWRAP